MRLATGHGLTVRAVLAACCLMPLAACGEDRASHTYAPAPSEWQFGATTTRNTAALLDDPADLDLPRRERPRDATHRDAVLSAYRSGGDATATKDKGGQP